MKLAGIATALLTVSCNGATTPDAGGSGTPDGTGAVDARTGPPYRHTIGIDGTNDFDPATEAFTTTSPTYGAFVTWDDYNLFIGYQGEDIGPTGAAPTKWLFIYVDIDNDGLPATGAVVGERYNTQQPGFPAGFGAELYYAWKTDDSFSQLRRYSAPDWVDDPSIPADPVKGGDFVEMAIPLTVFSSSQRFGLITFMLNEEELGEWAYAGLYQGSFPDGYYDADAAPIPVSYYLEVDLGRATAPNHPSLRKP